MERYTLEQRILIVKTHIRNGENLTSTIRALRNNFGVHNRPSRAAVKRLCEKFDRTGSVLDVKTSVRPRSGRSRENIAAVSDSVRDNPSTSIRHRSQQLDLSYTTMQRILTKDLHLHAYKIQLTQELKPADHEQRRIFVDWMLENHQLNENFSNKIIFSDEAHFQLNGYVNKQNSRIWGDENPRAIHEQPMHPQKVTVWCGFWAGGVIGPYFFENARGDAVTVNGDRYRGMLTNYFWHQLDNIGIEDMWFQQDGATCHTARETMQLLHTKFPGRVISRFGEQNWPPRSCDLTPLDFFLWGYVKQKVYANDPQTIVALKDEIRRVIYELPQNLCIKVIENFIKRAKVCRAARGSHLADIIFHV